MDVKDKIVIVTGASSGIGLALSKMLSENGAKVALVSRSQEKLNNISKNLKNSFVVVADMSKEDEVRQMVKKVFDHYGSIDILVNNAGVGYYASIEDTKIENLKKVFDLNVVGPLVAMQSVIPIMKKQGGGIIINISSGTALMYIPNMSVYSSSKRALGGISLTANEELKNHNIKVSVVYPTITNTNFLQNAIKEQHMNLSNRNSQIPEVDSAEYVAEKVLYAIKTSESEIFAHDYMKR